MKPARHIDRLLEIMAALRTKETGCPWDLQQNSTSIAHYAVEEAYEVVDAIERGDTADLVDELGDLLLQVVFHAQIASESGIFEFSDVVEAITRKMIRRHPHVFGQAGNIAAADVKILWSQIKAQEKAERAARNGSKARSGLLADIPIALPGLARAVKLQAKAGSVGFDWNDPRAVLAKIREEADEIEAALAEGDRDEIAGEIGDVLFAVANLARHIDVDPEACLRRTNAKFERRFAHIEQAMAARGQSINTASLEEMELFWREAKGLEQNGAFKIA